LKVIKRTVGLIR